MSFPPPPRSGAPFENHGRPTASGQPVAPGQFGSGAPTYAGPGAPGPEVPPPVSAPVPTPASAAGMAKALAGAVLGIGVLGVLVGFAPYHQAYSVSVSAFEGIGVVVVALLLLAGVTAALGLLPAAPGRAVTDVSALAVPFSVTALVVAFGHLVVGGQGLEGSRGFGLFLLLVLALAQSAVAVALLLATVGRLKPPAPRPARQPAGYGYGGQGVGSPGYGYGGQGFGAQGFGAQGFGAQGPGATYANPQYGVPGQGHSGPAGGYGPGPAPQGGYPSEPTRAFPPPPYGTGQYPSAGPEAPGRADTGPASRQGGDGPR